MCVKNQSNGRQWSWELYCAAKVNLLIPDFSLARVRVAVLIKSVSQAQTASKTATNQMRTHSHSHTPEPDELSVM